MCERCSSVKEYWDMACPKCGDDSQIDVTATVSVRLTRDGSDQDEAGSHDTEWSDESDAVCMNCMFQGKVTDFKLIEQEGEADGIPE